MRRALACLLCLAACARPPALDDTVTEADRSAPYPKLVPLEDILDATPDGPAPVAFPDVSARADALRARASVLRGPVVPAPDRARMEAGVDTAALR